MNDTMTKAIEMLREEGFHIHMRDEGDTYAYYTDGKSIAYFEWDRPSGWNLSSVCIPNATTGSGYALLRGATLAEFKAKAKAAFWDIPEWVLNRDLKSWRRYPSWEAFAKASKWNAGYKRVA